MWFCWCGFPMCKQNGFLKVLLRGTMEAEASDICWLPPRKPGPESVCYWLKAQPEAIQPLWSIRKYTQNGLCLHKPAHCVPSVGGKSDQLSLCSFPYRTTTEVLTEDITLLTARTVKGNAGSSSTTTRWWKFPRLQSSPRPHTSSSTLLWPCESAGKTLVCESILHERQQVAVHLGLRVWLKKFQCQSKFPSPPEGWGHRANTVTWSSSTLHLVILMTIARRASIFYFLTMTSIKPVMPLTTCARTNYLTGL